MAGFGTARHDRSPVQEVVDDAVNQTLTRSLNMHLLSCSPYLPIAVWGETLKYFALAQIIGFCGLYTSILLLVPTDLVARAHRSIEAVPVASRAS